ncbi:diguanylate cyclase domain-containing protein [Blastococcus capsensis]|uniref:diguanylate cyclase domain-containing protein n=1 Tax=Blastococcus capsensis TaxID=1564163 RepID=UPI00254131D9|nr:diguanylate cyclase [Blastococcus capsensis]MDK3257465.1 diguanylate cyclase [Blastococcus capsensis]
MPRPGDARGLTEELREGTVLARLGGDEFVILLRDCTEEEVAQVARRALAAVRRPCQVEGVTLEVDGSCGVAVHGGSATDLLRHADVAMYAAKADHLGLAVYAPSMDAGAAARLSLSGDLRRAIRDGELVVHYQPQVRCWTPASPPRSPGCSTSTACPPRAWSLRSPRARP